MLIKKFALMSLITITCVFILASCAHGTSSDNSSTPSVPTTTPGLSLSDITGTWVSTESGSKNSGSKGTFTYTNEITENIAADGTYIKIIKSTRVNGTYGTWIEYSCSRAKVSVSNLVLSMQFTDFYWAETPTLNEAAIPWRAESAINLYDIPIAIVNGKKYFDFNVYVRQGIGTSIIGTWTSLNSNTLGSGAKEYRKITMTFTNTTCETKIWYNDPGTFTAQPTTDICTYTFANEAVTSTPTTGTPTTKQDTVTVLGDLLVFGNGATKVK